MTTFSDGVFFLSEASVSLLQETGGLTRPHSNSTSNENSYSMSLQKLRSSEGMYCKSLKELLRYHVDVLRQDTKCSKFLGESEKHMRIDSCFSQISIIYDLHRSFCQVSIFFTVK